MIYHPYYKEAKSILLRYEICCCCLYLNGSSLSPPPPRPKNKIAKWYSNLKIEMENREVHKCSDL